jgi:tetratricopeptide (TPR) repeat protein
MVNREREGAEEWYAEAHALACWGMARDAIPSYSLAIECEPGHIKAHLGRAVAFQSVAEHARAIDDFDSVIDSSRDLPIAHLAFYGRAVSRHALGQAAGAIADCNEALLRNPELNDAVYVRGTAWKCLGDIDAAVRDMDAVIRADPNYQQAYVVRAKSRYMQRRWKEAITDFTAAIEWMQGSATTDRECFFLRGLAAQQLGDHRAAIADLSRSIELNPENSGAYFRRSLRFREIGEQQLADADLQSGRRASAGNQMQPPWAE